MGTQSKQLKYTIAGQEVYLSPRQANLVDMMCAWKGVDRLALVRNGCPRTAFALSQEISRLRSKLGRRAIKTDVRPLMGEQGPIRH